MHPEVRLLRRLERSRYVRLYHRSRWKGLTRSQAGREGREAAKLDPFSHTPPPDDEKGKKAAWAVARATLAIAAVMMVLYVVLPP